MVTRIFNAPVNYKGSDGAWHAIDNSLAPSPLGGYENASNAFSLRIPESLSAGVSLSNQGHSLAFTLLGASTALPTVNAGTATYSGVLPSTDLSYVSQSSGVQEFATLKDTGAPSKLTYQISGSTGLSPRQQADGSIAMVDQQGASWFTIPAPAAFPAAAAGAGRALPMSVSASGSGWLLSVDTGEPWVRAALASAPVVVDPTVEIAGTHSCELVAETPKGSFCSLSHMQVGYDATHQEHHALLGFSLSSIPSAAVILHAKLGLDLISHSTSTAKAVGVYRVIKPWTTSATWETYDGTHAWSTAGGDYSNPGENSDASVNPSVGAANGWYYWYMTKLVQEWANGSSAPAGEGYPKEGLIVKDETDNKTANLLQFTATGGSEAPYLEIAYEPRGEGSQPQYTTLSTPLTDRSQMSVNVASGNLMVQASDLQMSGVAGLGFNSTRTWNSLSPDVSEYGRWSDSNANENALTHWADGTVAVAGPSGGWFTFLRQSNKTFITPPGIKAVMCETGSPEPCPTSLPSGSKYRLTYNGSQNYVDYNEEGLGSGVHDRFGNTIAAEYPSKERANYTDTHSHKIEEFSNKQYFVTEIKDVSGSRNTKYAYHGTGSNAELEKSTDANGKITTYQYEAGTPPENYRLTKITDPSGNVADFAYDSENRVTEIIRTTNAEHTKGPTTHLVYYETGKAPGKYCTSTQKATLVRDPDWTKPAKEEEGEKFTLAAHETLYCANVLDEVEKTFDAEGNETSSTYDKYANTTSTAAPAREAGAKAGVTSRVYDPPGQNLLCEVQGTTSKAECPGALLKQGYATEALYKDTTYLYQPTETLSAVRATTRLCYYGGTKCVEKEKEGATGAGGALKQETEPGEAKSTTYDSYEKDGSLSSSTDFDGHTTSYEYEAGNLKTVLPPSGSGLGKQTITVDADSRPHIIVQCLAESSCTSNHTTTLTYDPIDRVTEAVYTGPGATKTIKYTYNADGELEKQVDPTGTTTYTRDPLGRITEEALPGSVSNAYTYDEASNLASFTDAGGTTHYAYNALNELESMYEPGGTCTGTPSKCTKFAYDNAGSPTKTTYPSGASMRYKLDPTTGRILTAEADGTKGEALLSNTYAYYEGSGFDTPLIYLDKFTGPGGATAETDYSYEAPEQLTEALTISKTAAYQSCYHYKYDAAGNIKLQESTPSGETCTANQIHMDYNAGNEVECRRTGTEECSKSTTKISGYKYDGAGNETAITGYSDPASTTFAFNNLSQLETLTPPGKAEEKLKYLGSGQRELTGLGTTTLQNSTLGITKQTIEGSASYYARTPTGTLTDERLPGGTTYNPVYDTQGDVIGLLNSSGELAQTIRYGPYGENTNATAIGTGPAYSPTNDPFLFQSGYHTAGGNAGVGNVPNGLYHFGERYYDPTTGRWTQPDPEGEGYGFAGDDPVNNSDPSGERWDACHSPSCARRGSSQSGMGGTGRCRSGAESHGKCVVKESPPRPSWCKVADLIVWGGGALSVALKAASLAAGSVIVGAVFINQCGP